MAKKIFVWVGHPRGTSLSHGLADAYQSAAEKAGAEVKRMDLHDMSFDLDLTYGYQQRKDHEPCLTEFLDAIKWADHVAWFHPLWWGGMPAKMQAAIDRVFLPGLAFDYHEDDPWWDKLFEGRTADLMVTADTPGFFIKWMYGNPHKKRMTKQVLGFTGIKTSNYVHLAQAKTANEAKLKKWIASAAALGTKAAKS